MIITFKTPLEDLGGIDAFDTDSADREDLVILCGTLARAVERMTEERTEAEPGTGVESTDERKLTLAVMKVISRAGVTQWVALSALSTNVAGVVASIDQLPPKGVDSVAKLFARKTAKLAHQFKKREGRTALRGAGAAAAK